MSSISGLGQGLSQFIQNLSATASSAASGIVSQLNAATSTAGASSTQQVQGSGHHHHGSGGGAFLQKISQAVTSALQSAQSSGADPNQSIEQAIAKVLQGNNSSSTTSTNDQGSETPGSSDSDGVQSFLQTLQSFGIDPEQFRQDFMNAIQQVGGQSQATNGTATLPAGTLVDETA